MAIGEATQSFVSVDKIKDGCVLTKEGTLVKVILTNSLNLSLKSEDEQSAILFQFQNLLNTLDFPVQINVQSRRMDIRPYLKILEDRKNQVTENLLQIQIHEYIDFIRKFAETTNIMTKHFMIIIPYTIPVIGGGASAYNSIFGGGQTRSTNDKINFETYKTQLEERVSVVMQGLSRFGVKSTALNTEELLELYYKMYNPGEQDRSAPNLNAINK